MPTIITLAAHKGGSGKSTLALSLYGAFRADGVATLLVDADPQNSLGDAQRLAGTDALEVHTGWPGRAELEAAHPGTAVFIVDTPGLYSQALNPILAGSDAVLIPMQATALDRAALGPILKQLEAAKATNPPMVAAIVLNRVRHATKGFRDDIRATLAGTGLPVLATEITERVSYQRAPLEGGTVYQTTDSKAQDEVTALALELATLMRTP